LASLNNVEDVLLSHMHSRPVCGSIIRMNDFLMFEHETKLSDGNWLLVIYRYDSKSGLTANKIFDREGLMDVTEKYRNHPSVVDPIRLINSEIESFRAIK
jgi:hypothetical protein